MNRFLFIANTNRPELSIGVSQDITIALDIGFDLDTDVTRRDTGLG